MKVCSVLVTVVTSPQRSAGAEAERRAVCTSREPGQQSFLGHGRERQKGGLGYESWDMVEEHILDWSRVWGCGCSSASVHLPLLVLRMFSFSIQRQDHQSINKQTTDMYTFSKCLSHILLHLAYVFDARWFQGCHCSHSSFC